MRFHWGHGIFAVIVAFVAIMGVFIYIAMQQTNDMIDEKYYDKELAYQGLIEASANLQKVTSTPLVTQQATTVRIGLPTAIATNISESRLEFLKPDNARFDVKSTLQPDTAGVMELPLDKFQPGLYKVRLYWKAHSLPYYKEEELLIKK